MSGFKSNQSGDPSYNDYSNTDASDQVIDFSKIYDVEGDDRRPPPIENLQLSLTSGNSEVIQQPPDPSDEVKFFYTEGTPIIKSSASSYWDLREVGTVEQSSENLMSEVHTSIEPCFPLAHNFSMGAASTSADNCINSTLVADEIHSFDPTENRESSKEDGYIIQLTEASFTKSSSPLMFSRSSSVGSLNSFEQHSIVDDRSSVSAFSNLASGMISPSEIPDSPFEVASPFISKNKNNEFLFPSNDKPDDPLVDRTVPNGDFPDEAFEDFVENPDLIKVYDDEGDNQSVSNLSALSIQANSTHVSISVIQSKNGLVCLTQKSSVTVNCSVTDGEATFIGNSQNLEISGKSDVPEQNCINTIPSRPLDVNQSENTQNITKEDKGTSTSEDSNFCDSDFEHILNSSSSAKMSTPLKKNKKFICEEGYRVNSLFQHYREEQQLQSSDYSKDNSDDESDDLLAECILSGKPSKDKPMFNDSKQSLSLSFQTSGSSLKDSFDVPNCSFSDNDFSDDDDDGMLNECVRLGMPQSNTMQVEAGKSPALEIPSCSIVNTNELPVSNSPSRQLKILDEILLQEKHIMQKSVEENLNLVAPECIAKEEIPRNFAKEEIPRNFAKEEEFSTFNLISQSKNQLDDTQNDLAESDDDSDNDESNLLVQEIIQLGMPKSQLRSPKSQKGTKPPVIYPPNKDLGCRDNCPDGVSDGEDEDDDLLNEIIKAGKPDYKPDANKSAYSKPGPSLKSQNQRRLTAAEDRQLYLNSSLYRNIPPINPEDIACVYNTEGTPTLSPAPSFSDLSTLSFTEDKSGEESFLNNSRNSDCSSDSEDDELLQQCIRQGMPAPRRVAA